MSAQSSIEWTDRTWNPVRGCSVVSPGCVNCYAMKQAHRFSGVGGPYDGLTKLTKAGPQWTGKVVTVEKALLEPLSWKKPQRIFVNSMSDLFHEGVPDEFIDQVFAVMALAPRHTFQILTKRAERMRAYFAGQRNRVAIVAKDLSKKVRPFALPSEAVFDGRRVAFGEPWMIHAWPLPNVWLGVSVEDQQRANERIPLLLQTPAAVRFISAEPLLGRVDLSQWLPVDTIGGVEMETWLDWVIVGGESGPGARPLDVAWARSIAEQCKAAGVACFVKQIGDVPMMDEQEWRSARLTRILNHRNQLRVPDGFVPLAAVHKGGEPEEWPEDLRVREFPC